MTLAELNKQLRIIQKIYGGSHNIVVAKGKWRVIDVAYDKRLEAVVLKMEKNKEE